MDLADGLQQYGFLAMVALAVGGLLLAVLFPYFSGAKQTEKRVKAITTDARAPVKQGLRARLLSEDPKDARRKQVQESLTQVEERERQRRRKLTLRVLMMQAGIETSPRRFYIISLAVGAVIGLGIVVVGVPWYAAIIAGIAGSLGLPRWFLKYLRRRRQ